MEYELGDIINGTIDYRGKTPERFESGIPVLSAANVKKGKIKIDEKFVSQEYYDKWTTRGYIKPGDILITTEAPVGEIAKVPNDQVYLISRRVFALQINEKLANETYVYYLLLTEGVLKYFEAISHGATAPRIYKDEVLKLKINLPDLPTQKQIASILSSYDDLIENNNQRIKLLENMAEEIYKEWFVRLRFPGYKEANFLDKEGIQVTHGTKGAIPEGWQRKPLDGFNSFSKSDSKLRKFKGEKRYLATADITDIKISNEGEIINWDNKPSRAQLKPEMHSVFFARMSNTYKVLNFTDSNSKLIDELALTSGFLGLKAKNELCFAYLFSLIKGDNFHNYKDVYANGATQVSLTNEGLHMIRLIEPKIELIEKYGAIVNPFYDEINILMTKNKILQETRDLLLPRLISGKLSLEDLEM
jgi:type I restriction enzyme S subunit